MNGKWIGWRAAEEIVTHLVLKERRKAFEKQNQSHYYFRKKVKQTIKQMVGNIQ